MKRWTQAAAFLVLFAILLFFGKRAVQSSAVSAIETKDASSLLVIMYHGILPDGNAGLGDYVISVSEFDADLRYLTDNGYTTVTAREVIDHVKNGSPLPEKAVMLTFDDGYYNNYVYAFPLLQEYSAHMVLSPIAKWTDVYSKDGTKDVRYTHVTWEHLQKMLDSGLVEVANHTYDLHTLGHGRKGCARKSGESVASYQSMLQDDLQRAQNLFSDNLHVTPAVFTYPFGAISKEAGDVLRAMGFEAVLTCTEKINRLTNEESLYSLGRYKRPHGVESREFFQSILS